MPNNAIETDFSLGHLNKRPAHPSSAIVDVGSTRDEQTLAFGKCTSKLDAISSKN